MDQQIIYEVFNNYLEACEVLSIDDDFVEKVKRQKDQLRPGFVIGKDGRILEWDRPYVEMEPGHRHMSHLYGFHPGNMVAREAGSEVKDAIRKTLDYRLDNGGAGPGWSRAWLINCYARLLDGEKAHEHIQLLLQKSTGDNLFNIHPPFQIDGNFGYTAGIAEMLMQSHEDGIIRILPALPPIWKTGHIKGIRARGGKTLDIYWRNNELEKVIISSEYDSEFSLIYKDKVVPMEMEGGESYVYR